MNTPVNFCFQSFFHKVAFREFFYFGFQELIKIHNGSNLGDHLGYSIT